ncbi:hypothetical protein BGZ67_004271 [Mortierella alpina]|nr:hypothetical protein BGZ67_004271 [Mortierella alpina]
MPFAHATSAHAPVPEMLDKDYRDAFEAAIEHYIQSFLQMNHPRAETRIELKNLQQQWRRLCRGRRWIDPQSDFFMLQRHHILDQQLAPDFVSRLNMASLAHELFTPPLDRTKCIRGLEGMRSIFLPEISQLSDETRWPVREVFLQLAVITLVLQARYIESSESVSMVGLLGACDSSIIPDLTLLVNTNITELLNLAERVSGDEGKLEALVSDTMVKTIAQMKTFHQTLTAPVCQSLVEDLKQTRKREMEELRRDIPKSMLELGENEIWLRDDAFMDRQDMDEDQRDTSPGSEIETSLYPSKSNGRKRTPSVIDLDEPMDVGRDGGTRQTEHAHGAGSKEHLVTNSEPCSNPVRRRRPSFQLPRLQSFFEGQETPFFTAGSEHLGNGDAGTSLCKVIKQLETTRSSKIDLDSFQRRSGDQIRSKQQTITVEDEDDDAYLTDPSESSRTGSGSRNDRGPRATWWSALSSSSSSALRPRTAATPAIAARRRTKHWSRDEEDRLIKYVPFFRYAPQEIHRMKRKMEVRWSDLKDYDVQHGNVLRDRTQVMLKDKFRELKKKGRIRDGAASDNRLQTTNFALLC